MFRKIRNPKKEQDNLRIAKDVARLLRDGALIAIRRADGQIAFLSAATATAKQRAAALDPNTVIRREILFDPNQN